MKSYRNVAVSLMLALVLTTPAFAGEIHTGVTGPDRQPTPATNGVMQTGVTEGETHTGEAASTPEVADTVTAAALNLLQSVLTLL